MPGRCCRGRLCCASRVSSTDATDLLAASFFSSGADDVGCEDTVSFCQSARTGEHGKRLWDGSVGGLRGQKQVKLPRFVQTGENW